MANAAEHTDGAEIGMTIRQHTDSAGHRGIFCQVTDSIPSIPEQESAQADSERGRGLQIVQALATSIGFTSCPSGKAAWFTLAALDEPTYTRQANFEAETGA